MDIFIGAVAFIIVVGLGYRFFFQEKEEVTRPESGPNTTRPKDRFKDGRGPRRG